MLKVITPALALLLASIITPSDGQIALGAPNRIPKNLTSSMASVHTSLDVYNNPLDSERAIKGSPYLADKFEKGNVYTDMGNFSDVEARYNIFYDQIEFKEKDSIYAIGPDPVVRRIELKGQVFVVDIYEYKGKKTTGYFSLLESGALTLMTKMEVILREGQEPKPLQTEGLPARYDRMPDVYYYKIGSGPATKIRSLQKMIDTFPDHKIEMDGFVKQEDISAKNPTELIKFVRHYNSLKSK